MYVAKDIAIERTHRAECVVATQEVLVAGGAWAREHPVTNKSEWDDYHTDTDSYRPGSSRGASHGFS